MNTNVSLVTIPQIPVGQAPLMDVDSYEFVAAFSGGNAKDGNIDAALTKVLSAANRLVAEIVTAQTIDERRSHALMVMSYASLCCLPGYASLNAGHIRRIREAVKAIVEYKIDKSLVRPLNFLVLATPGSGKSQLVKSISQQLGRETFGMVAFNMATMQSKDNLVGVLDLARNVVVDGRLPLVFLDEFDSHQTHYPLLLPLLWDGELDVGNRDLRIGRSVFFLAGSRPSLPQRIGGARDMFERDDTAVKDDDKLIDLFSRINGEVIEVPSLLPNDAVADKIAVAMHLLRVRFKACLDVPRTLLTFIAKARFRYEARSIATLINMIRVELANEIVSLTPEQLVTLPFGSTKALKESPLAFHLVDPDGAMGILQCWEAARTVAGQQPIRGYEYEEMPFGTSDWAQFAAAILARFAIVKPTADELTADGVPPINTTGKSTKLLPTNSRRPKVMPRAKNNLKKALTKRNQRRRG